MSSSILSAPVTEFAFITLKEGKESERGDLERSLAELQEKVCAAEGFHASSWGQSVDPGKENVYIFVLGWDTAAAHWRAVAPGTTCGKLVDQLKLIADIDLTHAAIKNPSK